MVARYGTDFFSTLKWPSLVRDMHWVENTHRMGEGSLYGWVSSLTILHLAASMHANNNNFFFGQIQSS